MKNIDCTESSSVPRLLSLLVASIEEASQACSSSSWGGEYHHLENTRSATATCSSSLRIRGLRRAYNILLFGGPSHPEIVAQAALEDSNHYCCDNFDAGPSVAAAVSA
ncbi:unnamed protein product, partial [Ectocarpus sp. 12 AP-2014]